MHGMLVCEHMFKTESGTHVLESQTKFVRGPLIETYWIPDFLFFVQDKLFHEPPRTCLGMFEALPMSTCSKSVS